LGAYIVRRLFISIPVLLGITIIAFVSLKLSPGDPLLTMANPEVLARIEGDPAILANERHLLGLDLPLPIQYLNWIGGILQGDFGYSIYTRRPVIDMISAAIWPTVFLIGTAYSLAVVVGVPVGVFTAVRQYSKFDYSLNAFSILMASTPPFVLGLILIFVFAIFLHVLPTGELHTNDVSSIPDAFVHLILPASVLALGAAAPLVRYTRASMLDVLHSEYVTTARSKGLPPMTVVARHAVRNGLIPVITLVALLLPDAVGGAIITEQVFNWPGMGQLSVSAANTRDPSLMMGLILMFGTVVLLGNLLADILYAVLDPRVSYDRAR